jgi:hypothetical protein
VKSKIDRRAMIQPVLDAEVERWSKKSCDELVSELKEEQNYVVELESKEYQVEILLLENTASYLHISVAVDDGHLPQAMFPASQSFICQKDFQDGSGSLTP